MEMLSSSDFIKKFHNLDGVLIGERTKGFYIILNNASENLTAHDIDNAIDNLKPSTYQEKLFFVKTLIYFKKIRALIEVLKQCNREHINLILKQKWFFQEAFQDAIPSALVNEFFPSVSFSTRLKLLGKIPYYWPEEKNDELFDCVRKRYGFLNALHCLHGCSAVKIEWHLKEQTAKLTTKQIICLLNRDENLIRTYFNCHYGVETPYGEKNVINLLAIKSTSLLLELINKKQVLIEKLSKKASVKLINLAKTKVLADPSFFKIFHFKTLIKSLKSDLKTFIKNQFPQKIEKLNSHSILLKVFEQYPEKLRWKLFCDIYYTVFPNKTIDEFLQITDTFLITLNPDKETVFKWAEFNYKSNYDDIYLTYFPPSVSITILKEKINVTSDATKRQELIKLLISNCAFYKDLKSLDEVLEYIGSRHKNEDPTIYRKYITFLLEKFKTLELDKNHWNFVHQQFIFIKTQGLVEFDYYENIIVELIKYSYEKDQDLFKIIIPDYLKDVYNERLWYFNNFITNFENYKFKFELFIEMFELFTVVIVNDSEYFFSIYRIFLQTVIQLSTEYPNRRINLLQYPDFVAVIQNLCNKNDLSYYEASIISLGIQYNLSFPENSLSFLDKSTVQKYLFTLKKRDLINEVENLFNEIAKKKKISELESTIISFVLENYKQSIFLRPLKVLENHPLLLLPYIEKYWSSLQLIYNYKKVKQYSHIGFDKALCGFLINYWSKAGLSEQKDILCILLNLLSVEDFTDFLNKYLIVNRQDINSHNVQCHLVGIFKIVSEPLIYFPLLQNFCTEMYIKSAFPSLCSFFARSTEEFLYGFNESIFMKNIALKKYGILLGCMFLKQDYAVNLLQNTTLEDPSLCLTTLSYFKNTSNDELFPLVIKCISMIKIFDKKLLSKLVKCTVPKIYKSEYIEICWKTIMDTSKDNNKFLNDLLKNTFEEGVITRLSSSFVKNVVSHYLPIEGTDRLSNIEKFTILCLCYRESERISNYKLVFDILSKLTEKNINNFCKTTIDCYYSNNINLKFIDDFIKHWNEKFSFTETLNEHITLQLFQKNVGKTEEIQAKNIVDYLDELLTQLGPHVFQIFLNNLQKYFCYVDELLKYKILFLMLNYKKSSVICVLILKLLKPVNHDLNENEKVVFKNIIETIKTVDERIVRCYYEMYLHNL